MSDVLERLRPLFHPRGVIVTGVSAHLTSPVGAHSMNAGLVEAHDLGDKIAEILGGNASTELLEGYSLEHLDRWRFLLGIDGPSLILRGSRARFFKVGLRAFASELFGAARRLYEDVRPALGPLARRSMERYLERVEEVEQGVRSGLARSEE